jgi:hypothetical protein
MRTHPKLSPLVVLTLVLVLGSSVPAWARSSKTKSRSSHVTHSETRYASSRGLPNAVTIDPIGVAFGVGNLEYQRLITPTSALAGRVLFGWGFGVGASWRFFLLDNVRAPEGLYLGPGLDLYGYTYNFGGQSASAMFFMPKADFGYRFMFPMSERISFVLAPNLSLGMSFGSVSVGGSTYSGGFFFGLGCGLGIAF